MRTYLAHIRITLKLTLRDRLVLFFNYLFPLVFLFVFAQTFGRAYAGAITQVTGMVLILGVLGNGFFGAGMRAVADRETNILRRFKVAPISPGPILVASLVTGWMQYISSAALILTVAHFGYGMPAPLNWFSLLALLTIGLAAFRSMGLIIAAVVNSLQESQILIQLFYLPMLFLSGATFPVTFMPVWLQTVGQFLPATYLFNGLQSILIRREGVGQNLEAAGALALTTGVGLLLATKLFRWEKEEKVRASSKLWLLAVMAPFVAMGIYQAYTRQHVDKARSLYREMRRGGAFLIRDAHIFAGGGRVIERGSVLYRDGRIEQVYEGPAPDARKLGARVLEGSGKTVLPGLIDARVHLASPGGSYPNPADHDPAKAIPRALAAYLYCGVTAVRAAGEPVQFTRQAQARVESGERLGAQVRVCGPRFTAEAGIDCLEAAPMDPAALRSLIEEARRRNLPVAVETGSIRDVSDAVAARADCIERGALREHIPQELFQAMARAGVAFNPLLSMLEARAALAAGSVAPLDRPLVQQVGPPALLEGTRRWMGSPDALRLRPNAQGAGEALAIGRENLLRAHQAGVKLVAGSGSGIPPLVHGPALHRELQLWVQAGVPPAAALEAATANAARLLGLEGRAGLIRKGLPANLLVVEGNPLEDISATERISMVIFRGENVERDELFGRP